MRFELRLPHVGESVTEAVLGPWLKQPGDRVTKFEPIVEVVTDKVTMEFPVPVSGVLTRILAQEGETLQMGSVIAEMEIDSRSSKELTENTDSMIDKEVSQIPLRDRLGSMTSGVNVGPTGGIFQDKSADPLIGSSTRSVEGSRIEPASSVYSPVVARLASEYGLDLSSITGTGARGRITKRDVLRTAKGITSHVTSERGGQLLESDSTVVDPSPVRKQIAAHMELSSREIPHAWSAIEVDVTGLVEWRERNKMVFEERHKIRLSFLSIMLWSVAGVLRSHLNVNSSWEQDGIKLNNRCNVGVAVSTDQGLMVPVVHDADKRSVSEIAVCLSRLVHKARTGKLDVRNVQGATFTLNNTGALGSVLGGSIIPRHQAAILNTEVIVKRPVVMSGSAQQEIGIRSMMNLCISFDHRILDGSQISAFIQDVRKMLEAIGPETSIQ